MKDLLMQLAALVMSAAVSFGQMAPPTGGSGGIWGWMSGVVRPKNDNTPTGTGFWKTTFQQNGTNWVCYTFWTSGTWRVSGTVTGDLLVVAGGGNGGIDPDAFPWPGPPGDPNPPYGAGGGGGGGEYYHLEGTTFVSGVYTVMVGQATQNSSFASISCNGGGSGGSKTNGLEGGSGGGGAYLYRGAASVVGVGIGNQGASGGTVEGGVGAGGGGGGAGSNGYKSNTDGVGGAGGSGIACAIDGSNRVYCAGGGGGGTGAAGSAGSAWAGTGGVPGAGNYSNNTATAGRENTGSGGGGGFYAPAASGGSGVVIVRIRR